MNHGLTEYYGDDMPPEKELTTAVLRARKREATRLRANEKKLKPCGKCKGVGAPWNNSASVPCDDCGGTGTSPNGRQTTAGEHHR
jgi:DnaJ-class molecular chaperone